MKWACDVRKNSVGERPTQMLLHLSWTVSTEHTISHYTSLVNWRIYASLGLSELNHCDMVCSVETVHDKCNNIWVGRSPTLFFRTSQSFLLFSGSTVITCSDFINNYFTLYYGMYKIKIFALAKQKYLPWKVQRELKEANLKALTLEPN